MPTDIEAPATQVDGQAAAPTAQTELLLTEFIDIDNDVPGVYALGHHEADAFCAAIAHRWPQALIDRCRIRHSWLRLYPSGFRSHRHAFEELLEFQVGAQPATVVEFWY